MVQVAVLDDHPAVVAGLRRLIDREPGASVLAAECRPTDLARRLAGQCADVLVLGHDHSDADGVIRCRRIKHRPNPPAVIVYSAHAGPGLVLAARAAQADAVIDKAAPFHVLLEAIHAVARGETRLPVIPRDAFETAVMKLDDEELPIFAMQLDRQPVDAPLRRAPRGGMISARDRPA
jgi:DNA-binding NarL/FixJ family response regulator